MNKEKEKMCGMKSLFSIIVYVCSNVIFSQVFSFFYERKDGMAWNRICTFLAVSIVLYVLGRGREAIQKGNKQNVPDWKKTSVWVIFSVALALGLNILFWKLGFLSLDSGYQEVSQSLYRVSIPMGIILYGIAAPLAEEMLFRGILFQDFKTYLKPVYAAAASAIIFGLYHGNVVQAVYGFCMGFVFAYAYEDTESFMTPLLMHGIVNIVVFCVSSH